MFCGLERLLANSGLSRRVQTHYHVHGEKILHFVTVVLDRFSFVPGTSLLSLFVDMHGFGPAKRDSDRRGHSAVGHALDLDLAVVVAHISLADAEAESGALPTLVAEEQRKAQGRQVGEMPLLCRQWRIFRWYVSVRQTP